MSTREQREMEQQCASELFNAIKQVINESNCTYRDVIAVLGKLEMTYRKESVSRKVRQ